ncbi:hypothetical protein [Lactobacillus kitasatonis]|uniref:Integral membrane protein n=1 Tax=Lactobacillus kitasatonis TaxID=237446 RepID=A0ABS1LUU0_9LACO|nr:hypothetical protein [Lactobacillus kitasatonis]MBL1072027.1 hypothetical protein [Lactobacillus kitasatonis]
MKNMKKIILRVLMIICTAVSFFLLLTSVISLKINDTQAMGKEVINRVVSDSDNPNLKEGVRFLEASGLEQTLLKQLPKKYKIEMSYANLYQVCEKYNDKGKLTPKDLNLSSKTRLEEIINEYMVKQINHKLKEKSDQVYHAISIYEYSIFAVALLFLLAAILIIFGRASASVPLAIASVGSFMALWIAANDITNVLQANVYSGINVTLSQGVWIGLIVGLATTVLWPILLKLTKEVKDKK